MPTNMVDPAEAIAVAHAEKNVLGCVLFDEGTRCVFAKVYPILKADDFFDPRHGTIYSAFVALHDRGEPIDLTTTITELASMREGRGVLNAIGGMQYLGELFEWTTSTVNAEVYARSVAEFAMIRATRQHLSDALATAHLAGKPREIRASVDEHLAKIPNGVVGAKPDHIEAYVEGAVKELEEGLDAKMNGGVPLARWGLVALDGEVTESGFVSEGLLGGLFPEKLYVLAGLPGAGKTTLAWQAVLTTAIGNQYTPGRRVLVFSLEMSGIELCKRIAGQAASVSATKIGRSEFTQEEFTAYSNELQRLSPLPINIIGVEQCRTQKDVRARVLAERAKGDVGLVVIDYLQLLANPAGTRDENRADAEKIQAFHLLAVEAKVPTVVISGMTKSAQNDASEGKVRATGTKGGGTEYAADAIMFVMKESFDDTSMTPRVKIVVPKMRNGGQGEVTVIFDMPHGKFVDLPTAGREGAVPDSGYNIDDGI